MSTAIDSVTGLPNATEANTAARIAVGSPQNFLLIAVVNRLETMNLSLGYAVGDCILRASAAHLRTHLRSSDELYRWHGPILLGILDREDRIDQVRAQIRRFTDVDLDQTVEIGDRALVLPISFDWAIFQMTSPWDALLRRVEEFAAARVPARPHSIA